MRERTSDLIDEPTYNSVSRAICFQRVEPPRDIDFRPDVLGRVACRFAQEAQLLLQVLPLPFNVVVRAGRHAVLRHAALLREGCPSGESAALSDLLHELCCVYAVGTVRVVVRKVDLQKGHKSLGLTVAHGGREVPDCLLEGHDVLGADREFSRD